MSRFTPSLDPRACSVAVRRSSGIPFACDRTASLRETAVTGLLQHARPTPDPASRCKPGSKRVTDTNGVTHTHTHTHPYPYRPPPTRRPARGLRDGGHQQASAAALLRGVRGAGGAQRGGRQRRQPSAVRAHPVRLHGGEREAAAACLRRQGASPPSRAAAGGGGGGGGAVGRVGVPAVAQGGRSRTSHDQAAQGGQGGCSPTSQAAQRGQGGCSRTSEAAQGGQGGCSHTSQAAQRGQGGCSPTGETAQRAHQPCDTRTSLRMAQRRLGGVGIAGSVARYACDQQALLKRHLPISGPR